MGEHMEQQFDAVEAHTVAVLLDYEGGEYAETLGAQADYDFALNGAGNLKYVMFSVYGHMVGGGIMCLADCVTIHDARLVMVALAKFWDVPHGDHMFNPRG